MPNDSERRIFELLRRQNLVETWDVCSPLLFVILIDCVMRIAYEGSHGAYSREILSVMWNMDDLDYADDLAFLACTQAQIRDKIDKVWQTARRAELEINAPKTKVMCVNTTLDSSPTIAVETLECVNSK